MWLMSDSFTFQGNTSSKEIRVKCDKDMLAVMILEGLTLRFYTYSISIQNNLFPKQFKKSLQKCVLLDLNH